MSRRVPAAGAPEPTEDPFVFEGKPAPAGRTTRLEVPVARLASGTWLALPLVIVRGLERGPTMWMSGAVHGDELNGPVIVDELVGQLDPQSLRGAVLAAPLVNAFGLVLGSRYLPDRRDLNRCFPGSARGSLGARLANLLSRLVISRCDFGIDFHTGSGGRENLPQIRCNLDDPRAARLARAFAPPAIVHADLRDGSLRAHAESLQKTGLLYEGGEANRLGDDSIEAGVAGALRVMARASMIAEAPPAKNRARLFRTKRWVRASRSGFCRTKVRLGETLKEGQTVAQIIDPALGTRSAIKAPSAGMAIGKVTDGLVIAGDALLHIAGPD